MDMMKFADATSDYTEIFYEVKDLVATLTINRSLSHNTYSTSTLVELAHAFRRASFDDYVAVIVFTGEGDRAGAGKSSEFR